MGFSWVALDESSDREQRYAFMVAGYHARQARWIEIERQWMLRLNGSAIPSR
jgi:hypothetical protein